MIPFSWAISPISLIGWIVQISLFANITEIRIVSGRIAFFNSSMETVPNSSTGTAETHATVYTPEKDKVIASTVLGQGGSSGFPAVPKFESVSIEPGNKTEFAGLECKVLSVPGHTPGSVAYYFKKEKCVFVGDTLFLESIGRTDFPFSSHEQLVTSIRSELFSLPDDTIVYPGHGPETSIGYEKEHNAFL